MGVVYEINWFLVIASIEDIEEIDNKKYNIKKSEKRIYPIDSEIPLIIKNTGCIAMVNIESFEVNKNSTSIVYYLVKEFDVNSEIAKHYYEMYKYMKNKL